MIARKQFIGLSDESLLFLAGMVVMVLNCLSLAVAAFAVAAFTVATFAAVSIGEVLLFSKLILLLSVSVFICALLQSSHFVMLCAY